MDKPETHRATVHSAGTETLEAQLASAKEDYRGVKAANARLLTALTATREMLLSRKLTDLQDVLQTFGSQLLALPQVDGCAIHLIEQSGEALSTVYLSLPPEFAGISATYHGFKYRIDDNDVNAVVFRDGAGAVVTEGDLGQFAQTTRMRFERWKMRSLVVLPLTADGPSGSSEQIGTVALFSTGHLLDLQCAPELDAVMDVYASQLQVHWRYEQVVQRAKYVESMYAETHQFVSYIAQMNSLTAVEYVYESIGKEFIKRFHFDVVNILMADETTLSMVHTSFSAPYKHLEEDWESFRQKTSYALGVNEGQSALIFSSKQRFLVGDAEKIMHLPMSQKDRDALAILATPRTFLIVPIRLNDEVIGVMWLVTLAAPIMLTANELSLIELLASFVSTAIRNAQIHTIVEQQNTEIDSLNQELQSKVELLDQIARKDRLTGLDNFGSFEEELKRRTSESARAGGHAPLAVILIDVDHFKKFNDTYGHPAGNEVLREVAARMQKAVRDMDFVARYGGEEFVVLLPQCDIAGALAIAERIRSQMADRPFYAGGMEHQVAISGGCAQLLNEEKPQDLIRRVDAALYEAKHRGRNRIESAGAAT